MIIVAIECCCGPYSIAITKDGEEIFYYHSEKQNMQAEELASKLDEELRALKINYKDIHAYALSVGPGSFTGIRIGIAFVLGLSFVNNNKLITVTTLEALAYDKGNITATLPAGRDKYYSQKFTNNIATQDIVLATIEELKNESIVGYLANPSTLPNARGVMKAALAKVAVNDYQTKLTPLYVREADAKVRQVI